MGLLQAAQNAIGGVMANQWREFYYMDAMADNVLAARANRRVNPRIGGSRVERENLIADGSVIVVGAGQAMIIAEQGRIVEFAAEPGAYVYDASEAPSLLLGDLPRELLSSAFKRFCFKGIAPRDARVYFINTRELTGNNYGTPSPVPYRVVDRNIGLDADISLKCYGVYSYRIVNPIVFYENVCGNVPAVFTRDRLEETMRAELITALMPAFGKLSEAGVRYSSLPAHATDFAAALNAALSEKWLALRGISVVSVSVKSVRASDEDEAMLRELQRKAVLRDPNMAAATLVDAQADAMRSAARNAGGAIVGFASVEAAARAGGANAAQLYALNKNQPGAEWICACGSRQSGSFCSECGRPKPAAAGAEARGWRCNKCGALNKGRFCTECGSKKPAGALQYRCDKCGWTPPDPTRPPKFCPECGDPFGDEDIV